jgi:hypothetical protein
MDGAFRHNERLTCRKVDDTFFKIDQQSPGYDVEEFVIPIVFVPMVLAFDDPNPNNGVVHLAQGLIEPLKIDRFCELLDINHLKRLM